MALNLKVEVGAAQVRVRAFPPPLTPSAEGIVRRTLAPARARRLAFLPLPVDVPLQPGHDRLRRCGPSPPCVLSSRAGSLIGHPLPSLRLSPRVPAPPPPPRCAPLTHASSLQTDPREERRHRGHGCRSRSLPAGRRSPHGPLAPPRAYAHVLRHEERRSRGLPQEAQTPQGAPRCAPRAALYLTRGARSKRSTAPARWCSSTTRRACGRSSRPSARRCRASRFELHRHVLSRHASPDTSPAARHQEPRGVLARPHSASAAAERAAADADDGHAVAAPDAVAGGPGHRAQRHRRVQEEVLRHGAPHAPLSDCFSLAPPALIRLAARHAPPLTLALSRRTRPWTRAIRSS